MVPLEYKIRHCCFKYQKIHNMFLMSAVWNKAFCWQYQITQNVTHSYDLQSSLIFHPLYAKQLDFSPSICKAAWFSTSDHNLYMQSSWDYWILDCRQKHKILSETIWTRMEREPIPMSVFLEQQHFRILKRWTVKGLSGVLPSYTSWVYHWVPQLLSNWIHKGTSKKIRQLH
jgi:hypothetical protein